MAILDYRVFIVLVSVFLIVFLVSRMVALGSIVASLGMPVSVVLFYHQYDYWWLLLILISLMTLTLILRHKSNIVRMVQGRENKFSFGKKA